MPKYRPMPPRATRDRMLLADPLGYDRWIRTRMKQADALDALDPKSRAARRALRNAGEPYVTYSDPPNPRGNRAERRAAAQAYAAAERTARRAAIRAARSTR